MFRSDYLFILVLVMFIALAGLIMSILILGQLI